MKNQIEYTYLVGSSPTICARLQGDTAYIDEKDSLLEPKCIQIGTLTGDKWDKMIDSSRRVYSDEGISPTVHTCGGGNTELKVQTLEVKQPTIEDIIAKLEGGNKDE